MKSIKDFSVIGKRVLVRCDLNVPLDEKGNILDDYRIKKALPTIKYLIENKAKIILMSHLGDPKGAVVQELKMDRVAEKLAEHLNLAIAKENDCVGPEVENVSNALNPGTILMLENLRFHKEEEENNAEFAKKLSYLGEIYVNEAFSVCHRKHASISQVPLLMDSCMGILFEKEIQSLDKILGKSLPAGRQVERPMVAIVGGKKVETKAKFINNISKVSDTVIVSGLIKKEISEKNIVFEFPEKIIGPSGELDALDINNESIEKFKQIVKSAKTILWNGPFGKFEDEKYAKGTLEIANAIIESNAFSVVGGGETIEFLEKKDIIDKFTHVSAGGGAMLAYLSGEEMPGLFALT